MPLRLRHKTLHAASLSIAVDPVSMAADMKSPPDTLACLLPSVAATIATATATSTTVLQKQCGSYCKIL